MTPERWHQVQELFAGASGLGGEARAQYLDVACGSDSALRGEVASLLEAHEVREAIVDRPATDYVSGGGELESEPDRRRGMRVGPYELEERIGSGGMGEVYRAHRADAQFEKQVAVKLVRSGYDTRFILERFRAERQILAGLEHPGIARLIDGGASADGLPYLVMELVEGEPIDRYCESGGLSIAQRLRLFRQVCDVVSYAHQRLVVHRDLKPGNILVTADGSIKLLDFGIAKLLQDQPLTLAEATVTAVTPLTPAFSSPEQIRGLPITTASDVYSLGVILFHLIAGRSPYRSGLTSPREAIQEVCETEPMRPSIAAAAADSIRKPRAIPDRELDDIALKALRKEPVKRYASVEQFSADIERYLTGQPVLAHGDQFSYLAWKFIRRYRIELIAASFIGLTLLGGIVATTYQAHVARQQEARAERNFLRVRTLARSLLFELHDSIQDLPGATEARRLLVKEALRYLAELSDDAAGDVSMQRDLAAGYERIGDIQGNPFTPSLGDTAGALQSYEAARGLRQSIYAASAAPADGLSLARILRLHAAALTFTGKIQPANDELRGALGLTEGITHALPSNTEALEELYQEYTDLAGILGGYYNSANLGNQEAARAAHEQQLATATRLLELEPESTRARSFEIVARITFGDQLFATGRVREAAAYFSAVQPELESLAASTGTTQNFQRLHALYTRLSGVRLWANHPVEAVPVNRAAFALAQRLAGDSKNAYARLDVGTDYANLADALSQAGLLDEARRDATQGLEILRSLEAAQPANSEFRVTYALALYLAGEVEHRHGDRVAALRYFRQALAIFEQMRAADPANADARLHVAAMFVRIADVQATAGDSRVARETYLRAASVAGADDAAARTDEARYVLAGAYAGLGHLELRAATPHEPAAQRRAHIAAACDWLIRGERESSGIPEVGAITPNGFYLQVSPDAEMRSRCKARGGF